MGKWKRSGADALREYENTTNYAYNQGGNTLTQGKKASRSGLDALTEYEQGGGLERAYENYRAAVLERQRTAISKANYETKQNYQQQEAARKQELQNYTEAGASTAVKNTAYENYVNAVKQRELVQKQNAGATLTPGEQHFLQTQQYKAPVETAQKQANQTNQKIAQATVEKVKASDVLTKQEFSKDAQVAGENGTYKDYMQRQYDSASIEAMQEQSDALAAQITEQEQKIRDRQTAMGEVTGEESQARQEEMKRKIASGELESTGEMEAQLAALQQEKALLDQKRAQKRGDVALGALDEETLGLLDEYVHGASGYVREHANGYNKAGQSKKSARQDLIAKGYTEDEIKKLAEFYERREDYESATAEYAQMQELADNASGVGKALLSAATALGTPFKALGNIESVRGVLPSWLGGYQNEDMPTNIYSGLYRPVRVSSAIRSGTMADMGAAGQFLYQAGMSALDSAVNMALSIGLVGAAGLSGSAAQSAVANTMNWVMGSQVAADSVYEGIQSGKSNQDALIDGIVEGAIEGITEKYSVGDIIENLLSGKAVWKKVIRAFASEGAEEVASNWLNRIYDVTIKHDRSEILQAYNAYLKQGMDEKEALAKTLGDFAKEDGLSFLAGGLSGWAMSGIYRAFGDLSTEANVQSAAAWAIENGRVQDVIDIGLAQGEGKAYEQAAKMQEKVDAGQTPTQGEAASVLREYAKAQREAVEDAQGGKQEPENKTYQAYKNAVQEAERAQAAFEAARSGTQTSGDGESLFDVGEGWAEVDPAQYEGEQTAQLETELSAQEAATDSAWLEAQAKKRGYDEVTTAYYLNGNSTNLSVEEYDRKFQMAYERGKLGVAQSYAVRAAAGMNPDVARAAWNAGQKAAQTKSAEKYSIKNTRTMSWDEQMRALFNGKSHLKSSDSLYLGETETFINGTQPAPRYVPLSVINKALRQQQGSRSAHEMTPNDIRGLESGMKNAIAVIDNPERNAIVYITEKMAGDGETVIVTFDKSNNLFGETAHRATSIHARKNVAGLLNNLGTDATIYVKDKNKFDAIAVQQSGQSRELLAHIEFIDDSVAQKGETVKGKKTDNFLNGIGYRAERAGNYQLGNIVSEIQKNVKGGNEHGNNVSDARQKRDAGARAEKQTGSMERAAERRSESARRGEQRAAAARDQAKAWREVSVSEFGLSGDSTVRVMPEGAIAQNADAKRAAEFFRTAGVKDYQFVVGELAVETEHGTYYADALVTEDGTVVVRLDSAQYSAAQLAKHEGYHIAAGRNAELAARIRKRLVAEGKITKEQIESYIEAYNAIYGDNAEAYVEEIIADAYAGINRTEYGTSNIRTDVTMEVGKWTKKTGKSRAPPQTRYSISETGNSLRAETQDEITAQYQQTVHEILNGQKNVSGALLVGYTPEVYQKLGMPDLPFVVGSGHVYSMAKTASEAAADGRQRKGINYHGLGESVVADIMEFVKDPVMVIAAKDVDANVTPMRSTHSVVALIDVGIGKNSLVIPVAITAERTVDGVRMDVNAISSAYEKNTTALVNEAIAQFNTGENSVFYVKKEAANLLGAGVQFPERLEAAASSDGIVRKFDSKINMSVKNVTESQQFKRWFGDWQNHPERASRVVNADGTPRIMYHGTSAEFTVFDRSQGKKKVHLNVLGEGNYFTARQSAAARYGNNVMAAYLDIKNPYVFDTHSYNTVADQYAAEFGVERTTFTGRDVTRMLQGRGYDGVVGYDANGEVVIANAFTSNQIKSASDNVGTFDRNNPDIRFSANSQRFRDVLPERAAAYVTRVENQLLRNLTTNLGVAEGTRREALRSIADEIIYDVLRGEDLNTEKLNGLFETAWEEGRKIDREYYDQYKDVAKKIRTTPISISEQDRADIADFGQFRKQTFGTLRITKDGLPVDTAYAELREMAPELFPEGITAPSDQLLKLYDVASGIKITERTLNEGYGEDAKAWAQNDFDAAAQRFAEGLRLTKRYQQYREQAKEKLAVPQTVEEVENLAKELRAEKKKFERVRNKYLLTDADMKTVNMLLRGDTTVEAVQGRENVEAILKTYEAKANYDLLALRLKAWNQQRKQGLRDAAETALNAAEADKWVDKSKGLAYSRETMERNVRDIARKGKVDDAKADAFNNEYFYPVHKHESERKNYVVGLQDRIRALKLSRKVAEGNLVSESYAVQWLGEAEFNAEYLKTKYRGGKRGGFSYEEWVAAIEKFRAENPKLDYDKIERAVKEFRAVYDQLFQDMNRVRIENGYEPVDYMQGYFPHFQEEGGTLLTKFARQLGIESDAMPLPTTINGMTAAFKPGIRYMANIQQRLGYATAYDALQGFDRYVEVASDVVYHTGDIQKLRALATQIRYRASEEGVKKQIDNILQDPTKNPDEANEEVAHKLKDARFALSNFVDELDEYTNLLAGKKSRLDRGMEKLVGREAYNVTKAFEQRVGANMVAANIGSALTNFIPITQAWSQVSTQDIVSGMWQTLKNYKQADGLDTVSSFINNRSGYGRLVVTRMDKASNVAGWLMETIDGFTTGSVVRARYQQNLRLGMSEANAMQEADQFAANIMADRSKGSTPTLYQSRNPMVKLFTQFQLEVNNELSWIFKDMVPQERKKGVLALTKALLKFLIGSWIYNEVYEALVGRRAALDPLDILNDTVGDFTGYQLPNTVNAVLSGQWEFTKEKPGTYQAIKNLESSLVSELPGTQALTMLGLDEAWGLDIDSGRIAVSSAIPDIGAIEKALLASNEDMALKKKITTVANELIKPAAYVALPFGGGQAKKVVQGMEAVARGGSYTVDTEGRDKLQYPVYNQTKADTAKSLAQALLFGKTATEEAQSWIESGFQSLSADETAAYQSIAAYEDQRSTYDFIRAMKNIKLTADKKIFLGSYEGVSEEARAEYYYQVMATDKQQADMNGMSTAERIEYVKEQIRDAERDKLKEGIRAEFEAGTISEAKAMQKLVANDFAEDADEAYWKVDEWKRGDAGVYDEVLAVVDAGGDVKQAAQRYLDNGKKAGDIASSITSAYKQRYIAADAAERKRLKALLLDAYAALGYDRKDKSKDIDAWLKQD